MNDVVRLTDKQFDYLKKLVADDIQKKIAEKDHDGTFSRADLLLNLIKIHALERRESKKNIAYNKELVEDEPVESLVDDEPTITEVVPGKVCKKCGILKPLNEFTNIPKMRDGKASMCKACVREYQNARNRKKGKA